MQITDDKKNHVLLPKKTLKLQMFWDAFSYILIKKL